MAKEIERLEVLIGAQTQEFTKQIEGVKAQLRDLGSTAQLVGDKTGKGLFASMMKANVASGLLFGTFRRLTNITSSLTRSIVAGGSAYSRMIVATDTIARNMGITSEQVQQLRDDLADANTWGTNAETVIRTLAMSGLIRMSQGLEMVDARTGKLKKGVTALTLAMKDLSASAVIDSTTGIQRLTKFIQRGDATFADGIIELGNLNMEYKAYAQSIGKTVAQLSAQERAQVRMNIVMREAQKVWGTYANTYQTSGKAIASIRDITKAVSEMLGRTFEPALRVGSNAILQFFISVRNYLRASGKDIADFASKVAGYMVALVRIIGKILMHLPNVGKYFANLANFTVKPIKALGDMANKSKGAGVGLNNLSSNMDNTAKSADKLKKSLDGLAGFDEMNVLKQDTGSGNSLNDLGGGGLPSTIGAGGGGGLEIADTSKEINAWADKAEAGMLKILKPLAKIYNFFHKIKIFGKPLTTVFTKLALAFGAFSIAWKILSPFLSLGVKAFGMLSTVGSTLLEVFAGLNPLILVVSGVIAGLALVIKNLWQNNEQFRASVLDTWQKIKDTISGVISVLKQKLPLLQQQVQPITDWFKKVFPKAVDATGKVIAWLWSNILKPFIDFVLANIVPALSLYLDVNLKIIEVVKKVANVIITVLTPVFKVLWQVVSTVFKAIASVVGWLWDKVFRPAFNNMYNLFTGLIIPIFKDLFAVAKWVFSGIAWVVGYVWQKQLKPSFDKITGFITQYLIPTFNNFKDKVVGVFNTIGDKGAGLWWRIAGAFKTPFNWLIDKLNTVIYYINRMLGGLDNVSGKVPGFSPITYRLDYIPKLAKGGVVDNPTLAWVGERGKEAVLPLENNTGWINELATKISNAGGSSNGATVIVKLGEKTIFEEFVEYINDRSLISNKPLLNL